MASKIKFQAEHDYSVGQVIYVHPADVQADDSQNVRSAPHDKEAIAELAESIKEHGQLQPVVARKAKDGVLHLVAGYRRHAAATLICEEDPNFRLKLVLTDCNDEEAFSRNLEENIEREQLSHIDLAHAQRRAAETWGWDQKKIAAKFRMSQGNVSRLKQLLTLPSKIQKQLHRGELTLTAALALTDVSAEEAEKIVDETPTEEAAPDAKDAPPKRKKRSAKIRKKAEELSGKGKGKKPKDEDEPTGKRASLSEARMLATCLLDGGREGSTVHAVGDILTRFFTGQLGVAEAEGELLDVLA